MERRETGGFIVDAYLSNDIDDYIYTVNRPILYLKTVTGGELKAIVCSQLLKDYMELISDSTVRRKIERINALFRNCPNDEESVRELMKKL